MPDLDFASVQREQLWKWNAAAEVITTTLLAVGRLILFVEVWARAVSPNICGLVSDGGRGEFSCATTFLATASEA